MIDSESIFETAVAGSIVFLFVYYPIRWCMPYIAPPYYRAMFRSTLEQLWSRILSLSLEDLLNFFYWYLIKLLFCGILKTTSSILSLAAFLVSLAKDLLGYLISTLIVQSQSSILNVGDYVEILGCPDDLETMVGRRGHIVSFKEDRNGRSRLVVVEGHSFVRIETKEQFVFCYENDVDSFSRQRAAVGPTSIKGLLNDEPSTNPHTAFIYHESARKIDSWCTEDEIQHFLRDDEQLQMLMSRMLRPLDIITAWMIGGLQSNEQEELLANATFTNKACCWGCVACREEPGFTCGRTIQEVPSNIPELYRKVPVPDVTSDYHLPNNLHFATIAMEVICSLLKQKEADKLVLLLTCRQKDYAVGVVDEDHATDRLAWFVLNTSDKFPKQAEIAIGLLSLLAIKNPTVMLTSHHNYLLSEAALFRAAAIIKSVASHLPVTPAKFMSLSSWHHLDLDFLQLSNETYIAAKLVIDMLPLLYYFGGWRDSQGRHSNALKQLGTNLHIIMTLLTVMTVRLPGPSCDCAPDTEKYPQLAHLAPVFYNEILVCDEDNAGEERWRQGLLKEHPVSFAIARLYEVIGWWAHKGCNFYGDRGRTEVLSPLGRLKPVLERIAKETPRLSYVSLIASAFERNEIPATPDRLEYLLYGPLFFQNRRCGLISCRKTVDEAGGTLLRCGGRCEGLEQYCCREHQVEHWKFHKSLCKRANVKDD